MENKIEKLKEEVKSLKKELKNYKKGYDILMDYWVYIPEDMQPDVDKQLKKLNL